VLPELLREVDSEWLAEPVAAHLAQTRTHVQRLQEVFRAVGVDEGSAASAALEGLRRQHDELAPSVVEPRLKDIFLAGAAARTEHLEIALYTSLLLLAGRLGVDAAPLERNLDEERAALKELENTAERLREQLPA
jgi:ferritin-like metal-binding protein YciE